MMHVGVAGCRPNISIETKAKNGPYDKLDVLKKKRPQGPFVDGPKEIKTSLDYEKCIEIAQNSRLETSDDAGLYLWYNCERASPIFNSLNFIFVASTFTIPACGKAQK